MINIVMFTDFISDKIGGMETHQEAFLKYYERNCKIATCKWCIVKQHNIISVYKERTEYKKFNNIKLLYIWLQTICDKKTCFFFNNLRWIRNLEKMKGIFQNVKFIIRSGGNDIYKVISAMPTKHLTQKMEMLAKIINNSVDKVIINSDYSYFRNLDLGIAPNKMLKIRGGVNYSQTKINILNKTYNRHLYDLKYGTYNKKIFIVASRLVKFKGILEFLKQLKKFMNYDMWHLLIVGDGPLKEQILKYLNANFLKSNWTYLGSLSNLETLKMISLSDLLINFSLEIKQKINQNNYFIHTETMGRTMMEAIAQKIPILALESGGTPELFYENESIGYMLSQEQDTCRYLLDFIFNGYELKSNVDYSWDKVFSAYNLLFQSFFQKENLPEALIFDFDGTLYDYNTDLNMLSIAMFENKGNKIYICNTARHYDEAIQLFNKFCFDYVIYENGWKIMSKQTNVNCWNNLTDLFIKDSEIATLYSYLKANILEKCDLTHSGTINIKINKTSNIDKIISSISKIIDNKRFIILQSNENIKIISKQFNKSTAVQYILKNHIISKTSGAGNGLNDVQFVLNCDVKFLREDLIKKIAIINKDVISYTTTEIGLPLFMNVLKKSQDQIIQKIPNIVFNNKFYSGKDEKYGVTIGNKNYILKPSVGENGKIKLLSEFVAHIIYKKLKISCQKVILTTYRNNLAVLIEDFICGNNVSFVPFLSLIEEQSDMSGADVSYSYENIVKIICNNPFIKSIESTLKHFWNMYVIDYLIAAVSRNASNWGFLKKNGKLYPSPVFDNTSAFYYQYYNLNHNIIFRKLISKISFNGKYCDRFDIIKSRKYKICNAVVDNVVSCLNINDILKILCQNGATTELDWFGNILENNFNNLVRISR